MKKRKMIASILAGVCTFGIGIGAFSVYKETANPATGLTEGVSGVVIEGEILNAAIAKEDFATYGVSESAESAYELTATISPSTSVQKITWTVAWNDASSAWATGKNVSDYVSIISKDNAPSAVAVCLQAFGEQVIITATATENTDLSAACTVDYVKRIESVNIGAVSEYSGGEAVQVIPLEQEVSFVATPTYGVGTITGELEIGADFVEGYEHLKYYIYYTDNFATQLGSLSGNSEIEIPAEETISPYSFTYNESQQTAAFYNNFLDAIKAMENESHVTVSTVYAYTYNGVTYSSGTASAEFTFSQGSAEYKSETVSLSDSAIIF